ncbi:peptidoglycan-binding protein [Streptomyces sp. NBC_01485]|uniref:peptidoglycan-binding domain-containing protein n=1 Tax=Streptomyces sp. NBC_01485 TaxID=2903884 RepID=UPI002E337EBA|nr:peptidoglycan-binding domain-containing protein [Streptomyces sp. NBC_01485]
MIDPTGQQGRPERHGLLCPECGALRAPDNTPSCSCARRAAETLHDTRTTEAAAAEDFNPLRIRPYVELDGAGASAKGADRGAADSGAGGGGPSGSSYSSRPSGASRSSDEADGELTMPLQAVPADATAALPTPFAPPVSAPSTTDLRLFEAADVGPARLGPAHLDDEEPRRPRRRRRALLVASSAAVVAVVAAAGFASGLFSYEKPTRDGAAPKDVRAAVPDTSTSSPASASPSVSRSASPSASDASPSPSESASPSPSASEESALPSTSPSATASETAPTVRATGSLGPPENGADKNGNGGSADGTVLRRGDTGAEVIELQLRLGQLSLYTGEVDGTFSGEVEEALRDYQSSKGTTADGPGVYGALTRAILESETKEP